MVNESRPGRIHYQEYFSDDQGFEAVSGREPGDVIEVRRIEDPDTSDQLILCRSQRRRDKEQAIKSKAEERFLETVTKLQNRVDSGRLKVKEKIDRAIGRLQKQHPRTARFYEIVHNPKSTPALSWIRKEEKYAKDDDVLGGYIIRTDEQNLKPDEVWQMYMTLTRAEAAFKSLKGDLGLRPNFHQLESRVDGHIFLTVLGYHLYRTIMYQLEQKNDRRSWVTIRRLMETHCYSTMIIPSLHKTYRIRKAGLPDERQKNVYQKLNIEWKSLPLTKMKV